MKKILRWFCCLHWLLPGSDEDWKGEVVKMPDSTRDSISPAQVSG